MYSFYCSYFGNFYLFYLLDITLEFAISMQPLTENAQEYLLAFRHLGVITSYPRWVLVFYEKIRNLTNYQLFVLM